MATQVDKWESALVFVQDFAKKNAFFDAGEVLAAFRRSRNPWSQSDWSKSWGQVLPAAARKGWVVKHDVAKSKASHSHGKNVVVWKSRLYKGGMDAKSMLYHAPTGDSITDHLDAIKKQVYNRSMTLDRALWAAYTLGVEKQFRTAK